MRKYRGRGFCLRQLECESNGENEWKEKLFDKFCWMYAPVWLTEWENATGYLIPTEVEKCIMSFVNTKRRPGRREDMDAKMDCSF
jgi:hypothetical protein